MGEGVNRGNDMRSVYLCGGINGLSDDEAKGWRERASRALLDGWEVLDPMRRDFRGQEAVNVEAIVRGDLFDIDRCQALLVRADRPSWGTAMEVFYAARAGKRVVLFGVDPARISPWLSHHSEKAFATLDEAVAHLMRDTPCGSGSGCTASSV